MQNIIFNSYSRDEWLGTIISHLNIDVADNEVLLSFKDIPKDKLNPEHFVSLACFIEHIDRRGFRISVDKTNVGLYLHDTLNFRKYWAGGENHIRAKDEDILNLWRINNNEKDIYAEKVKEYLNTIYPNKDLSGIKQSIIEACYNVFDHADTDNAFSFVQFDREHSKINIAICDFGTGIAKTIRNKYAYIYSDSEALMKSIEPNFSVNSQAHNSGMGLTNIASNSENRFVIYSNTAMLVKKNDNIRVTEFGNNFNGSLLIIGIDIGQYEDIEEDVFCF